jgi:hypothetical protein
MLSWFGSCLVMMVVSRSCFTGCWLIVGSAILLDPTHHRMLLSMQVHAEDEAATEQAHADGQQKQQVQLGSATTSEHREGCCVRGYGDFASAHQAQVR